MTRRRLPCVPCVALAMLLVAPGCGSADEAEKAVRDASKDAIDASKDKASELADDAAKGATKLGNDAVDASKDAASDLADKAVDASKDAASDLADATKEGAEKLYDDLRNDGELSQSAKKWLSEQAEDASIEDIVTKGVQMAPVALEASKVLLDAVDRETAVEPIFQEVGSDTAKVDKAIGDMPRVEAIDGLTVGFKQMDKLDASTMVKHRGYLVMWRHEDYLVGFVYRSTRTIDLEKVVAEAPRLIRLTQAALD